EGDEVAVIDNGDAVAELVGLFHVVGGDEHGEIARVFEVVEHLPHGDAGDGIEAGGGLVKEEDARIVDQAAGNFKTAAHSAGESLGLRAAPLDEVDGFEDFLNILFALHFGNAVELGINAEV